MSKEPVEKDKFLRTCNTCGFPVMKSLKKVEWLRNPEWEEVPHKCLSIPESILSKLDVKRAKKVAKDLVKKYGVNSNDKIQMIAVPNVVDALMYNCFDLFFDDKKFDDWWNSGFPETNRISSGTPDHYQLVKLANVIVEEAIKCQ